MRGSHASTSAAAQIHSAVLRRLGEDGATPVHRRSAGRALTDRRYHAGMEQDGVRTCDGCGQRIPSMSKLATKSSDGRDLCLACQIRESEIKKGLVR
jgi:hypothetical protein